MLSCGTFSVVEGGVSNHAWRCEAEDGVWFVRLAGASSAGLGVDRDSEAALLWATAAAGISPPLRYCDPRSGLLVTRFVPGRAWTRADARGRVNLERAGDLLARLHRLPLRPGLRPRDFAATARALRDRLGVAAGRLGRQFEARAEVLFAELAARSDGPPVPCHNDVHHLNLIDEGERLWLVDWEYGGSGDPIYDLAGYCCHHRLTAAETATLLAACGGDGGAADPGRIDAACWVFDYVQWLWYRVAASGAGPDSAGELVRRAAELERVLTGRAGHGPADRA